MMSLKSDLKFLGFKMEKFLNGEYYLIGPMGKNCDVMYNWEWIAIECGSDAGIIIENVKLVTQRLGVE